MLFHSNSDSVINNNNVSLLLWKVQVIDFLPSINDCKEFHKLTDKMFWPLAIDNTQNFYTYVMDFKLKKFSFY